MDFSENYNILLKQMTCDVNKRKLIHQINQNSPLLPFKTNTPKKANFENGFDIILGELSRILLNKTIEKNFKLDNIVSNLIDNNIEIEDGTKEYITKLLNEYLFDEKNDLKISHPNLYLYIPLSNNKSSNGEQEVALFLRDIFCKNNQNLINFFESYDSNHIILNLILKNTPNLHHKITETKYVIHFEEIANLFNEDINYAILYKKFFMENIGNIFAYYYFFYISQLILKISKGFNDNNEFEKLYYLLDWESASKNRKSLNSYSLLKHHSKPLYAKMAVIDQLNTLLGTNNLLEKDISEYFNNLDINSKNNFLHFLKKWVSDYRYVRNFDDKELPDNLLELTEILFESLKNEKLGVDGAVQSRYALNLEDIAKKYLLKRRGSYGYVLNINRDMLLVLTALCVKDKKIKLNQLFIEFEKRGVYFDKYSKEEVVNFLTKLNLIDKKSDSGDAQYVKPVL